MLSWLALAWFLTVGYLPASETSIVNGYAAIGIEKSDVLSAKIGLSLEAFDSLKLYSSVETRMQSLSDPGLNGAFDPFEAYYRVGLEYSIPHLTLGIVHECDHGVQSTYHSSDWLSSAETQIYLTFSGKTQF